MRLKRCKGLESTDVVPLTIRTLIDMGESLIVERKVGVVVFVVFVVDFSPTGAARFRYGSEVGEISQQTGFGLIFVSSYFAFTESRVELDFQTVKQRRTRRTPFLQS